MLQRELSEKKNNAMAENCIDVEDDIMMIYVIIDEAVDGIYGYGGNYEYYNDNPAEVLNESQVLTYKQVELGNKAMILNMHQEGMPGLYVFLVE